MNNRTSQLAENAVMLGVAGVILLLSMTFIGGITYLFLPIPFLLLATKRSLRDLLVVSIAFLLLSYFIGRESGLIMGVSASMMGMLMGWAYRRTKMALPAIAAGAAVYFIVLVATIAFSVFVLQIDFTKIYEQVRNESMNMIDLSLANGLTKEEFEKQLGHMYELAIINLPFLMVLVSFMIAGIVHLLARQVAKRTKHEVPALSPIKDWSFPRSILYYYIIVILVVMFLGPTSTNTSLGKTVSNVHMLLTFILTLQGLSFAIWYCERKGWRFMKPILVLFIFSPLATILNLLGLIEMSFHLRKRIESREG